VKNRGERIAAVPSRRDRLVRRVENL